MPKNHSNGMIRKKSRTIVTRLGTSTWTPDSEELEWARQQQQTTGMIIPVTTGAWKSRLTAQQIREREEAENKR